MRMPEAFPYLAKIANATLPPDRMPENAEVNTRESEVVIRITAVEGLSALAQQESREADDMLLRLVKNDDLTVRQMAARGYLSSPIGNPEERLKQLMEMVPKEEHWYLTLQPTNIREVQHPEVLPDFNLKEFMDRKSADAPKINQ
jgi:hypothetical protein